jgi:hypothetical protein
VDMMVAKDRECVALHQPFTMEGGYVGWWWCVCPCREGGCVCGGVCVCG